MLARTTNSITRSVIARDKVRFHREIMVPGKQYEMTEQEILIYAKHISLIDMPAGRIKAGSGDVQKVSSKQPKKRKTTSRRKKK